ncbi:hypothetical protein [Amycolatopsis sp. NPDC003731]
MLKRAIGTAVLAAGCLLLAAGCAGEPGLRPLTGSEEALLYDAEQVLVRDCMARHGFRIQVTPSDRRPQPEPFPYVVDDVGWASEHGYGTDLRRIADAEAAADPNKAYFAGLPADRRKAALAALNGTGPGRVEAVLPVGGRLARYDNGCTSRAWQELYGDLATWYRVDKVTELLPGLWQGEVVADPAFTAGVTRWSGCMREAGFPYESPAAAREAAGRTPGDGEIRTAVAEATCAARTGLAATARELDRTCQDGVRAQYRTELETKLRLQLAGLPRARAVRANSQG